MPIMAKLVRSEDGTSRCFLKVKATRHVEASFGQLNASVRAGCVAVCVCLNLADQNFPLIVYALNTKKLFFLHLAAQCGALVSQPFFNEMG